MIEGGEHAHEIRLRLGDRHILSIVHQLTAKMRAHEGTAQELFCTGIQLVFRIAGTQQVDPLFELAKTQCHNGLMDRCRPLPQGEVHVEYCSGKLTVSTDQPGGEVHWNGKVYALKPNCPLCIAE